MQELVYYAVPNGKENCPTVEVIIRDSEHIYEKFFVEEFTDRINDVANFLFLFCDEYSDTFLEYQEMQQWISVMIDNKQDLINLLENLNTNRKSYRIIYKQHGSAQMVACCQQTGNLYLHIRKSDLHNVEWLLNKVATKSSFEKYELGE